MKKETKQIIALMLLCIALCFADNAWSQTVKIDSKGNYIAIAAKKTDKGYKDSGKTWLLYTTSHRPIPKNLATTPLPSGLADEIVFLSG